LDGVPVIGQIFGTKTYPFPGDPFTVNLAYSQNFAFTGGVEPSFQVWVAAQQRQIIDMSNLDTMLSVDSTGQNGNVFNPQKEDQTPAWVTGKYYTVSFTRAAAEKTAVDTLILEPTK
jgi:acyl-homoserine lactone acylase PvdQ